MVSVHSVPGILFGQLDCWRGDRYVVPQRRFADTILRCGKSQTSADLTYQQPSPCDIAQDRRPHKKLLFLILVCTVGPSKLLSPWSSRPVDLYLATVVRIFLLSPRLMSLAVSCLRLKYPYQTGRYSPNILSFNLSHTDRRPADKTILKRMISIPRNTFPDDVFMIR